MTVSDWLLVLVRKVASDVGLDVSLGNVLNSKEIRERTRQINSTKDCGTDDEAGC
jgi:hypothetical protein